MINLSVLCFTKQTGNEKFPIIFTQRKGESLFCPIHNIEFKLKGHECTDFSVTMDAGLQWVWAGLWHTCRNSCSPRPSTTTHLYYYHYQGPGWRNRCLALLPARQRVTWQRSLVKPRYCLPAPGCESHNIILLPLSLLSPSYQNVVRHGDTTSGV